MHIIDKQEGVSQRKRNPESSASIVSRLFFFWLNPLFRRGWLRELTFFDVFEPDGKDKSQLLSDHLQKEWSLELSRQTAGAAASLRMAIARAFGRRFAFLGIVALVQVNCRKCVLTFQAKTHYMKSEAVKIMQPVFMGGLIRYFRFNTELRSSDAYIYGCGVVLCSAFLALSNHLYYYSIQRMGMWVRVACSGLIYKKALKLSKTSLQKTTVGHVMNLLSSDVARFDMVVFFFHYLWLAPVALFAFLPLLWSELGAPCLAGFGAILLVMPLQGVFGRKMGQYRRLVAGFTDKRVSLMSEIVHAIRLIKMSVWEEPFTDLVDEIRTREVKFIRIHAVFQACVMGLYYSSGKLAIFATVLACFLSTGTISIEGVFVASALFNTLRFSFGLCLPLAMQFTAETIVSIQRIQAFLLSDEIALSMIDAAPANDVGMVRNGSSGKDHEVPGRHPIIEVKDFSASWGDDVHPGELLVIIGAVGGGKSSLLLALLGEMKREFGACKLRGTSVAYVSQEAFIYPGSLRQNVLFGKPYNEKQYNLALEASALDEDLHVLPHGDQTVVGDRGIRLSGGQRARVALARAIFADADIYLLDDPLSAVDTAVGKFLFERTICGTLATKAVVLVTHQLQYLEQCERIMVLERGSCVAVGNSKELRATVDQLASLFKKVRRSQSRDDAASEANGNVLNEFSSPKKATKATRLRLSSSETDVKGVDDTSEALLAVSSDAKVDNEKSYRKLVHADSTLSIVTTDLVGNISSSNIPAEDMAGGAVSWSVYYDYMCSMANLFVAALLLFFCFFVQIVFNSCDWWLNIWATKCEILELQRNLNNRSVSHDAFNRSRVDGTLNYFDGIGLDSFDYLYVYTALIVGLLFLGLLRAILFRCMAARASQNLHHRMFAAIVRAPISFFDANSAGRILNRFTKDVNICDDQLAFVYYDFVQGALQFLGMFVVVCMLSPWSALAVLPLAVLFTGFRQYYLRTSRDIRRLEAIARSPVLSHVSASLNGLSSIRAFSAQSSFLDDFHRLQNNHTSVFALTLSTARWFAVSIDWMSVLFVSSVVFVTFFAAADLTSGEIALCLFYAISITGHFAYNAQQSALVEVSMVSIERMLEYAKVEPEQMQAAVDDDSSCRHDWPSQGKISFKDASLRYDAHGPYALRNISFTIQPTEKVGILGRTGAGKSSLLSVLYRLYELSGGSIEIDGVNIQSVNRELLRKKISIIPQEPILFRGTFRRNLDPFSEFTDDELWSALEEVKLKEFVRSPLGLNSLIEEDGDNLSVGQKQLLCLARSLLRRSHILVLDEATANVDNETDALIQQTLRNVFKHCTVVTVAHRINTIMDADRIMVMSDGQLMEFDVPYILLQNNKSLLYRFVHETNPENANFLCEKARAAYFAKSSAA